MSETAPHDCPWPDNEHVERKLELIRNSFELDPDGQLFSAIWDVEVDVEDLRKRRYPTDAEKKAAKDAMTSGETSVIKHFKPVITTGEQLLTEIFCQVELLQPPSRLKNLDDGKESLMQTMDQGLSESDQLIFDSIDRLIRVHNTVKEHLSRARDKYYSEEFWDNPAQRKGLKTSELEELYMFTEPFEGQGILGAMDQVEASGAFSQDIIFEANRIARIMVARETNMIE